MLQIAANIGRRERLTQKEPRWTMIFLSEMTLRQVMIRALAEASGLQTEMIKTGIGLTEAHKDLIVERLKLMRELPIWVNDQSRPTPNEMLEQIDRFAADHSVRCVMFDYLEQVGTIHPSEELRISGAISAMKHIAKERNLTSLVLSQVNRAVEERADKRPLMSDLRYSGRIEAEADLVLLMYRQDYYESIGKIAAADLDPAKRGTAEIEIAKQRDGMTGRAVVQFVPERTSFMDLEG